MMWMPWKPDWNGSWPVPCDTRLSAPPERAASPDPEDQMMMVDAWYRGITVATKEDERVMGTWGEEDPEGKDTPLTQGVQGDKTSYPTPNLQTSSTPSQAAALELNASEFCQTRGGRGGTERTATGHAPSLEVSPRPTLTSDRQNVGEHGQGGKAEKEKQGSVGELQFSGLSLAVFGDEGKNGTELAQIDRPVQSPGFCKVTSPGRHMGSYTTVVQYIACTACTA
eukprot:CAMPEP_0174344532 /NCGR_PEP_ID=MMETSP0810-20121108/27721_1 /TAXON_ID=73025 ORGANISM="Eutreptiella gymnastica-like, Strain CCMP1594" /NCGR_SAMPLE_ID=MMETSP0810 /ASSEMBLY_ACC=CAM_ASM_000659 /LENGTH=224 /DNA_ID=CAMNT_0015467693 /DNA_START=2048 /DNA_END=2723 /DNA_ORIENTATION=-